MKEVVTEFPALSFLSNFFYIIFFLAAIWIFGRMGDNINKIRKMLEDELIKKKNS